MKRIVFFIVLILISISNVYSNATDSLSVDSISTPSLTLNEDLSLTPKPKKHFWRAAGEVFGLNVGLWAFDRYALKGHYAYINLNTIKANFKHGFDWDDDHLSTNMFAHPYHGSMYFNAGRANGFNYWQSELFAISGSAMWELFMECEYPSTNDIIATPIGGAALGEVFYRTTDLILDDRATGGKRFGREFASFLISPMRGLTRVITGDAWKRKPTSGKQFGKPNLSLDVSLGATMLGYHDGDNLAKLGATARIDMEYGDRFSETSFVPYDYFSFLMELDAMKTQPLLNRVEIIGRLANFELVDKKKFNLSVGAYQHFDFFDSDTINVDHDAPAWEPCSVPYKLGTPASVGVGTMFRFRGAKGTLDFCGHFNAVILGGVLSDFYRNYHRNYNWASGLSTKLGLNYTSLNKKFILEFHHQFYKLYTWNSWDPSMDLSLTPNGKPVDVQGDDSNASFNHLELRLNFNLWKELYLTLGMDYYRRYTEYFKWPEFEVPGLPSYKPSWVLMYSRQVSTQLMLTYRF